MLALLCGPYADVIPQQASQRLTRFATATGGYDVVDFSVTTPTDVAQVTAFYWTNRTNRWAGM